MARRPEARLQDKIVSFLEDRGWLVEETHGNAFQRGIPDLFCWNQQLGFFRWIDVKRRERHEYTQHQCQTWTHWEKHGLGVWIMMEPTDEEYAKLFEPPNFRVYWKPRYDKYLLTPVEVLVEEFPECG